MFRFELGEHEDSFHRVCACACARAGVYLHLAKCLFDPSGEEMDSWQVLRRRPYRRCSRADQDSFFIMDTKHTHFYLCTRSHLSADNINALGGVLISINTDIKRLAGVMAG